MWGKCAVQVWNVSNRDPADATFQPLIAQLLTRTRLGLTLLHIFETLHAASADGERCLSPYHEPPGCAALEMT
jgi:hypothetical protein